MNYSNEIPISDLYFQIGEKHQSDKLIKKYHYTGRVPSNIQFIGTFHIIDRASNSFSEAIAAIYFGIPPTRWKEPVLELTRLVRKEDVRVPLTRLISLACKNLKTNGYDLLVSYADAGEGHHGGVYQAAGWNYHGKRKSTMDGLIVNGKFIPGRSCNSKWGTRSPHKLRIKFPDWSIEPHYDVGKHLYWKSLGKIGEQKAARLGLQKNKYPKNQ